MIWILAKCNDAVLSTWVLTKPSRAFCGTFTPSPPPRIETVDMIELGRRHPRPRVLSWVGTDLGIRNCTCWLIDCIAILFYPLARQPLAVLNIFGNNVNVRIITCLDFSIWKSIIKLPDQDLSLIPVPGGMTHTAPDHTYYVVRSTHFSIVGQMQISLQSVFQY